MRRVEFDLRLCESEFCAVKALVVREDLRHDLFQSSHLRASHVDLLDESRRERATWLEPAHNETPSSRHAPAATAIDHSQPERMRG